MDTQTFIQASGLVKLHKAAGIEAVALQGLDFEARRGEFVALVGPSGSGKSTLLSALGGLDRPDAGRLSIGGVDLLALTPAQLTDYRRAQVGFVWQQTARNLLPYLSARRNIELLRALGGPARADRPGAGELLAAVGMAEHADRTLERLSGGQQQRVALACALANGPAILLGDEPTGEVDWPTARRILDLLGELRRRYGLTIVIVTHDLRVAQAADRAVAIRDGRASGEWGGSNGSLPQPSGELAVVDGAGRLQLPAELRALAGIGRRARVELRDGTLALAPVAGEGPAAENGAAGSHEEPSPLPAAGLAAALYSRRGPTP
jgi:peptide/nickel transport system ATP-binding protein